MAASTSTAALLTRLRGGDRDALERLYERVYDELRQIARRELRKERGPVALETTALVHEAYLRFVRTDQLDVADRAHFHAIVAKAMRRVLMDTARRVQAQKRGGNVIHVTFDGQEGARRHLNTPDEVVGLDLAIEKLARVDERQADVVVYRFYAGMDYQEIACVLGVSVPTVRRDWKAARALLTRWLKAA